MSESNADSVPTTDYKNTLDVDEARSFGLAGKVYALSNGELVLEEEELSWYHVVPIVNIFYDFFADAPPSPETLKEILNIFGLVSALLLSVAGGFPGSTSFQEIQDALERFQGTMMFPGRIA